jgi:hypothetical protein
MQVFSAAKVKTRLLRVVVDQHWIPGCPQTLNHVLLLADRHPDANGAVDFVVELGERFNLRLMLMHGGDLQRHPAFWTSDSQGAPDSDQARFALLCLLWEIRKRCPEVGLCAAKCRSPEQVWQAAAHLAVDLMVLSESLFGRFLPLVRWSGYDEMIEGAPCPVLVVGFRCKRLKGRDTALQTGMAEPTLSNGCARIDSTTLVHD